MKLYTHSNGNMYPYREKTRLQYLIEGILFFPLELIIVGFNYTNLVTALKSKKKWNDLITHESEDDLK